MSMEAEATGSTPAPEPSLEVPSLGSHVLPGHDIVPTELSHLDKVRDILFGTQVRDHEKKFLRLEEQMLKHTSVLRDEIGRRCDAIELYIQREVESLHDRLQTEQHDRADAERKLAEELKEVRLTFAHKASQLTEQVAVNQRELRHQLLEQSKSLRADIQQQHAEITALLEQQLQEIRASKTDRSVLSTLLIDMALRLNHESQPSASSEKPDTHL